VSPLGGRSDPPHRGCRGGAGRANSKKDLVTGPIQGFCALHAGLSPYRTRRWIDSNPFHRPQIDDNAAVADGQAGEAVPASAHGDGETGLPSETDRRDHVGDPSAPRDQGGEAVDRPVPDRAVLVVVQVAGLDDPAVEGCFELGESASAEPDLGSGEFHLVPIIAADPSLLYPAGSGERAGGRVPRAESLVSPSRSVGRRA
jgi:hypothetical protein